MLCFDPISISQHEKQERLRNLNTHIFVNAGRYLRGANGFICNNGACNGLYCVDDRMDLADECVYCGIGKRPGMLLIQS
ncbi:MAG: hypothetical protein WA941_05275 [Nitrososphaeraceae archaeon]